MLWVKVKERVQLYIYSPLGAFVAFSRVDSTVTFTFTGLSSLTFRLILK